MHQGKSTVERAFELARAGTCRSMDELRRELTREGYESVLAHLGGPSVGKQLREVMAAAR